MKTTSTPLAVCCLLVAGCRYEATNGGDQDDVFAAKTIPSNEEVLTKAYDTSYFVPEDFLVDERADTPGSYTVYHVKDSSNSYELCTDSFVEAQSWESADNASRAVNGDLVTSVENDRYFEFVRELSFPDSIGNVPGSTSPGFARVFKCNYVNRDGADRNLLDGYAGQLNARPLSEAAISTYSEYMWQFTFFWPASKKVLDTYSAESAEDYSNTLVLAFITNQGTGACDLIEVVEWEFALDKSSGEISKHYRPVYQMEAQLDNGIPRECTG